MASTTSPAAASIPGPTERLLRRLFPLSGSTVEDAASVLGRTVKELLDEVAPLRDIGVVVIDGGVLVIPPPRDALADLLASETATIATTMERLNRMAAIVVGLGREGEPVRGATVSATENLANVELVHGPPPSATLHEWIAQGHGELRFMRPEQWRMPTEPNTAAAFEQAIKAGLSVRCIYPVRAVQMARSVLEQHHAMGEEIRLLAEVPQQMAVVGDSHAMLVSGWVGGDLTTAVIREPLLVRILISYFDAMWQQGVALPGAPGHRGRNDERQLLLGELAKGERDEQIARSLGIGLRTVRRRVADLMIELGAETRFQAGVEAARRGWV